MTMRLGLNLSAISGAIFTFAEQLQKCGPCQGASDLQPLRHHCWRYQLVVGHLFVQFVIGGLVEEDQVIELVPHFSLGPLLLRKRNIPMMICTGLGTPSL